MKVLLINEPGDYADLLQVDLGSQRCGSNDMPDLVHLFVENTEMFESSMKRLKVIYKVKPSLVIWVSWYKKNSGIPTDITEDTIRLYALANGLVDIKVCAVTEIWSGLKLVVPLAKRQSTP